MVNPRVLPAIALCLVAAFAQPASAQSSDAPKYDGNKLIFPDGFRLQWLFVGSNIALQYKGEGGSGDGHTTAPAPQTAFHNVYITPTGYAGFRTSKTAFPDPTILVIDIYSAKTRDPHGVLSHGSYDGDQQGALVAVKDSSHPQGSGADKTDWAYYVFPDLSKPGATAAPQGPACNACHKKNGLVDNVWVQFYPVLRDVLKSGS